MELAAEKGSDVRAREEDGRARVIRVSIPSHLDSGPERSPELLASPLRAAAPPMQPLVT